MRKVDGCFTESTVSTSLLCIAQSFYLSSFLDKRICLSSKDGYVIRKEEEGFDPNEKRETTNGMRVF